MRRQLAKGDFSVLFLESPVEVLGLTLRLQPAMVTPSSFAPREGGVGRSYDPDL